MSGANLRRSTNIVVAGLAAAFAGAVAVGAARSQASEPPEFSALEGALTQLESGRFRVVHNQALDGPTWRKFQEAQTMFEYRVYVDVPSETVTVDHRRERFHWDGTALVRTGFSDQESVEDLNAFEPEAEALFDEAVSGFASSTWTTVDTPKTTFAALTDRGVDMQLSWARVDMQIAEQPRTIYLGVVPLSYASPRSGELRQVVIDQPPNSMVVRIIKADWTRTWLRTSSVLTYPRHLPFRDSSGARQLPRVGGGEEPSLLRSRLLKAFIGGTATALPPAVSVQGCLREQPRRRSGRRGIRLVKQGAPVRCRGRVPAGLRGGDSHHEGCTRW